MPSLTLDDSAALSLIAPHSSRGRLKEIAATLASIQSAFAAEYAAGLPELERNLRAWTTLHERPELAERTLTVAEKVRASFTNFVLVGIGGSDLGPRVAHEVLDHTRHNELCAPGRGGAPRMYFAGDTFDPRPLRELLDLLEARGELATTCFNIVSKSGKTPETLCTQLAIKERLGVNWAQQMVLTTGEDAKTSILRRLTESHDFFADLPVPEGVGGRFSEPSPVGLLPLAVSANAEIGTPADRLAAALSGHAEGHRRMLLSWDDEANLAFRLASCLQQAEEQLGLSTLVLYDYSNCRMLGDWLVQLYTESIQERGTGFNVIAARGPTSNHSLLNGIVSGPRDKAVLFIRWEDLGEDVAIPVDQSLGGDLGVFMGRNMMALQDASLRGTIADFTLNGIPCLELSIPKRDTAHLFLLMRTLMDMVAIKGRLQDLHIDAQSQPNYPRELTYQQDGVEGYKQAMRDLLAGESQPIAR